MNESPFPSVDATGRRGRRWLLLALGGLVLAWSAPASFAQTGAAQTLSSNRWLFVIDTSRAMKSRAESVRQVAATLLVSGLNGQMRRGDTVGVWTYDAELHLGNFPVQMWTPETGRDLARHVFGFLQAQKFEKESRLDQVVPRWNIVVTNSDLLTIVLISGGEEKIKGTPFDDAINDVYQAWKDEQEKAQMPFLTFLRAERGRITNQKVNMPPWPIELPPLPPEPKVTKAPEKIAPPPPVAQPLYFSGRKPATNQTQDVSQPTGISAPPSVLSTNSSNAVNENTSAAAEIKPSTVPDATTQVPRATIAAGAGVNAGEPTARPVAKSGERSASTAASAPKSETAPSPAASAVEATSAAPSGSFLQRNVIWIGALVLAGVASVLIWMMLRRSRSTAPVSLITRSLDREKE